MPSQFAAPTGAAPGAATVDGRITAPALVDARWLARHRDGVVVIDARAGSAFAAGHVPGSKSLPLDALVADDTSRPALARLASRTRDLLSERGIQPGDHVAFVDDCNGAAALGAAICELAGLRRASVVHGCGVEDWHATGQPLATGAAPAERATDPSAWDGVADRTAAVASFEDLVDAVVNGAAHVLDVRSQLEHEGIVGAPCCSSRGAIPGSVHLEWTSCFDILGRPHGPAQLRAMLDQVGIPPDAPVIVACHGGHRAAIAARVLRAAGVRNVRVSLGSWHEWCGKGLGGDEHDDAAAR